MVHGQEIGREGARTSVGEEERVRSGGSQGYGELKHSVEPFLPYNPLSSNVHIRVQVL